ncbi:MAG: hypothetical protein GY820_26860 [Gammaproteobacteria bacterium]|nr:hypothetical protein [Gammaproteobacteria bacterium]
MVLFNKLSTCLGWPQSTLDSVVSSAVSFVDNAEELIIQHPKLCNQFTVQDENESYCVKADENCLEFLCRCQKADSRRQYFCEHSVAVAEMNGSLQQYLTNVTDKIKAKNTVAYLKPVMPIGELCNCDSFGHVGITHP